jgi:RNA polymerase sigma-70 factor (ECF subfamily)
MDNTEELVWKQIQQKNLIAFEAYYKINYKGFVLASYNYVKSQTLAQEIVNDVFIKIWVDSEKITIESSLKSYIYRAIINSSINALHKEKRASKNQKELAHMQTESYELRQMETNELKILLYKTIEALPEQCKKVFQMSRMDGLKQQEIADKLGISIKTVKNHITHALKQLRKATGQAAILSLLLPTCFFQF